VDNQSLVRQLDARLSDVQFTKFLGDIGENGLKAFKQGLLDMPEEALKSLLNSNVRIVLGNTSSLKDALKAGGGNPDRISTSLGFLSPTGSSSARALAGGNPVLVVKTDANPDQIRWVTRHEAHHGVDHINASYKGYASESPAFEGALKKYLEAKPTNTVERTEIAFDGDRGFRHEHIPKYQRADYASELVAEMGNKYSALLTSHGAEHAEDFMSRNYPYVWDEMKNSVMPQINASLKMQGLDTNGRPLDVPLNRIDPNTPSSQTQGRPQQTLENIRTELGTNDIQAVRVRSSGNVEIKVPLGYSRGNFEALGIENPRATLRMKNFDDHAVITIPRDHAGMISGRLAGVIDNGIHPSIMDASKWQPTITGMGEAVTRIPVNDLGRDGAESLVDALKAQGLRPIIHQSDSLGPTIRLAGDDIAKLANIQAGNIPSPSLLSKIKGAISNFAADENGALTIPSSQVDNVADELADSLKYADEGVSGLSKYLDGGPLTGLVIGAAMGVGTVLLTDADIEDGARITFEAAIPFGETVTNFAEGDVEGAITATASEVAGIGGAIAGASVGTGWGAAAGGVVGGAIGALFGGVGAVPGAYIGSAAGAALGGIAGGLTGGVVAGVATEMAMKATGAAGAMVDGANYVMDSVGINTASLKVGYDSAVDGIKSMVQICLME